MTAWLMTYFLHSTLLIGGVALLSRLLDDRWLAVEEGLWRTAVLGGIVTATLQIGLGIVPLSGAWDLGSTSAQQSVAASASDIAFLPPALSPEAATSSEVATSVFDHMPAISAWLIALWLVIALSLILVLVAGQLRLERRLAGRRALDQGGLLELLDGLVSRTATRISVRLSTSTALRVPLAKGWWRHEICLPERLRSELAPDHQEIVLAHELAHLRRHDPLWLTVIRIVESLLFFQPLNRLARRRLQELAEYQCDDWTVAVTGRPLGMARCLANVAEWSLRGDRQAAAPALAHRGHRLERRVQRLLQRRRPLLHPRRSGWFLAGCTVLLLVTALAAPGFSVAGSDDDPQADPSSPTSPEKIEVTDPPPPPAAPVPPIPPPAAAPPAPPIPPAAVEAVPSAREIERLVRESLETRQRALEVELREVERALERQVRSIERDALAIEREVAREVERIERIPLELHELQIDRIEDLQREARETLERHRALQEAELQRLRQERRKLQPDQEPD